MPGRRGVMGHPAMATRVSELERGVPVEDLVGYEGLGEDQKEYLSLYLIHRDAAKVAEVMDMKVGVVDGWMEDEVFSGIVGAVQAQPKVLALRMMEEILPWSARRLYELALQTGNKSVQLQAIKHLHQVMGLAPQESGIPQGAFLNVQINTFSKNGTD